MSRLGALVSQLLDVLPRAFGPHGLVAAEAIRGLLEPLTPLELGALDLEVRPRLSYDSRIPAPDLAGISDPAVLGLISMHASGHFREAAVAALDAHPEARLAYLVIRLNDWVLPVRRRAVAACERRLTPERADDWIAVLPLLMRLRGQRRHDHAPFVSSALRLIEHPDSQAALERGTGASDLPVRRQCYRLLTQRGAAVAAALSDADIVVRLFAMDRLLADHGPGELLERAAHDSFMGVRQPALDALARHFPAQAGALLAAALLDRSLRVREVARYWMKQRVPGFDALPIYREALRGSTLGVGILGLSEVGTPAEAAQILPFQRHEQAGVRTAVVRALAWLDRDAHAALVIDALADPSPAVSRAAQKSLVKRLPPALAERVWRVAADPRVVWHGRRNAFRALMGQGKWRRLVYLLRAMLLDAKLAADAHTLFRIWDGQYNRNLSAPTPSEVAEIDQLLAHTAMSAGVVTAVQFVLSSWRPR